MSNVTKVGGAALPKRQLTPKEEEDLYFQDTNPNLAAVDILRVKVDRMCSVCGHWESEHPWETCMEPRWL